MKKEELDLTSPDLQKFIFYLSNGQTAMITCSNKENTERGIISVSWITPTSFDPFLMSIVMAKGTKGSPTYRYSYALINETGEFGINIPSKELKHAVLKVGTKHGDEVDKFVDAGLTPFYGGGITPPLIEECFLNIECKVLQEFDTGDHAVIVGKPVAVLYDVGVFAEGSFQQKYTDKNNQIHFIDILPNMV